MVTNRLSLIKPKPDIDIIVVCILTCGRNQCDYAYSIWNHYISFVLTLQ
jgi:hypothetical protein